MTTPTAYDLICAECGRIPGPTERDAYGFTPSPYPAIRAHREQHDPAALEDGHTYAGPAVTRVTFGTLHTLDTDALTVRVSTYRDEYGRGSSHAVGGTNPAGRSVTYARNLTARHALQLARQLHAQGWPRVAAYTEGF